jgi:hypothetical protein
MSDSAFPAGAFPGHTLEALKVSARNMDELVPNSPTLPKLKAEIARREAIAAGDYSNSTPGERLRAVREDERLSFEQVNGKCKKVKKS